MNHNWGPYLFLNEDGTFLHAQTYDAESPYFVGQYELEGTAVTIILDDDSPSCPGMTGISEFKFTEDGKLQETVIESECTGGFAEYLDPGDIAIWVRHSP